MTDKLISIYFCGGCNPHINRLEISQGVEKLLSAKNIKVIYNSFKAELIVYLSGCFSNCAQKYSESNIPCIVVAAATVDAVAIKEDKIIAEIVTRVERFYQLTDNPLLGMEYLSG